MRTIPKRKVLAEIVRDGIVFKVYDKEVLESILKELRETKAERPIIVKSEDIINLSEFCKGLTMKECVEKIKKEIPDYKNKLYQIAIEI